MPLWQFNATKYCGRKYREIIHYYDKIQCIHETNIVHLMKQCVCALAPNPHPTYCNQGERKKTAFNKIIYNNI